MICRDVFLAIDPLYRVLVVVLLCLSAFVLSPRQGWSVDNELAAPIVHQPLYKCSRVIAYSGAKKNAEIVVVVNGGEVKRVRTWMGWGEIPLDAPLQEGDNVAVAQIADGRESAPSRDPVTVENFPPDVLRPERLGTPSIVPPFYECQQRVRVDGILPGATAVLRAMDGTTWRTMTAGKRARFGTPKLMQSDELGDPNWYIAFQHVCEGTFPSHWSKKEYVQPKPSPLPPDTPVVVKRDLIPGNDAVPVEKLIPGALVDIYMIKGGQTTSVGRAIAEEAKTIFQVRPPIQAAADDYYAEQALCEAKSTSAKVKPVSEVPTPIVQGPICHGEHYVTVCNTVAISDPVLVSANGTIVADTSGNGDCVTTGLGDTKSFQAGESVTAQQFVGQLPSNRSDPPVPVKLTGAPAYNPSAWNFWPVVNRNNDYNYSVDMETGTFAQPGLAHGVDLWSSPGQPLSCASMEKALMADGIAKTSGEKECSGCTHKIAVAIDPTYKWDGFFGDFMMFRLDDNGIWSFKKGEWPATNKDASGNPIVNPETADLTWQGADFTQRFSEFCGYYCVDKDLVRIK